jgi:hypothetical protein
VKQNNFLTIFVQLINNSMETKGVMCASCGTWHYELVCPKCNSVVTIKTKTR